MALALITLCDSISDLNVSGVTILDLDQIPLGDLRGPMMFPEPLGFVKNFSMVRDSFGGGTTAKMTVEYDLTYTFLHSRVGTTRALETYPAMVDKAYEILDAILAIETITGAIDLTPADVVEFGPVPDPSGNMYHGCRIILHVKEFVN